MTAVSMPRPGSRPFQGRTVLQTIVALLEGFTISGAERACPGVGRDMIRLAEGPPAAEAHRLPGAWAERPVASNAVIAPIMPTFRTSRPSFGAYFRLSVRRTPRPSPPRR